MVPTNGSFRRLTHRDGSQMLMATFADLVAGEEYHHIAAILRQPTIKQMLMAAFADVAAVEERCRIAPFCASHPINRC